MLAIPFIIFVAVTVALAHVSVNNPLDLQYPLVARVDENYTWVMCSETFSTDLDKSLIYSAPNLPAWLHFDNNSLTLYGVPADTDEGRPNITIIATDTESTALSSFILCVTPYPAPTVQIPISRQFYAGNPALSSVFFLAPGSALATDEPTLRVPAGWSFSIGLDGNTFSAENDLFYGALQSNGRPLPHWITLDTATGTFDGVAPSDKDTPTPFTLEIDVYGADQEGYSAASVRFVLVVASHELSAYSTLPTVNITAGTPFNFSLTSQADFTGALIDGQPLQPTNVSVLSIDVSPYKNWLRYDAASKTLFGTPPDNFTAADGKPNLQVSLTSNFNQTLFTSVALNIVDSYFTESDLGKIDANPGQTLVFNLTHYFSNTSAQHSDANLSASFNPSSASAFLNFNSVTAELTGTIPKDSNIPRIGITFVAYSHITHSTSHATLIIESPDLEKIGGSGGGSGTDTPLKSKITLIVSLVFGIIGGIFLVGFALALFKRYTRVKDSTILGEEGTRAWTDEEKRWHGIGIEVREPTYERGYGWTSQPDTSAMSDKGSLETPVKEGLGYGLGNQSYSNLGLELQRVLPRAPTTPSTVQASCSDGVMKKSEFFGRIKNTARNVSDKYKRRSPPARPIISHPIPLVRRGEAEGMPVQRQFVDIVKLSPRAESAASIPDDHLTERRASTEASFITSPSSSTGERSIPRRRADFAPPNSPRSSRAPVPAAVRDTPRRSVVRGSLQSTSGISADLHPESLRPGEERPCLKQFTHASRVPPPRSPSNSVAAPEASSGTRRIASQTAQVYKENQEGRHMSIDELRIGMHYVRTLGEGASNLFSASNKSFSSLESSQQGHGTRTDGRFLVRTGEKFKFKVPMQHSNQYRKLEARLISGRALPGFMQAELKGFGKGDDKKGVEFYGVPLEKDVGELHVGVFNVEGGECLARVVVEVVARGKRTPPMAG